MPTKSSLVETARTLLHRLLTEEDKTTEGEEVDENAKSRGKSLIGPGERNQPVNKSQSKKNWWPSQISHPWVFKLYESTRPITSNLEFLLKTLKSIKPTSVESETNLSLAGLFVTKWRVRLQDKTANMLSILKSHFNIKWMPTPVCRTRISHFSSIKIIALLLKR